MRPLESLITALAPDEITGVIGLLILRHLYEGDIIDHPVPDDHPHKHVFDWLEQQGAIAKWDRIWPLRDRYRLTEFGIAEIERVYKPAEAEALMGELRAVPPKQRRDWMRSRGLDPVRWPAVNDPYTQWDTWATDPGPNWLLVNGDLGRPAPSEKITPEAVAPERPSIDDLDARHGLAGAHDHGIPGLDVS